MPELPSGTVTFLLTDVEGSTRFWQTHAEEMPGLLARHDALVATSVANHAGVLLKHRGEGDSKFAVFARATDAVAAACALQVTLAGDAGLAALPLRVRAAVHTGEVEPRDDDYFGAPVNLCARLRAAAHGGQTLLTQAVFDLARERLPDGAQVREVGTFRLRHVGRARRVYQIVPEGHPADFPPLVAEPVSPSNVPVELTDFIGRRRELAAVRRALRRTRLLTLIGVGGVGKTRLAQRVATTVADEYRDGVWWVDLAGLEDPSLVCREVSTALGVRAGPAATTMDAVLEWARRKEILLVLDSCEHLAEGCAAFVGRMLSTCPGVRVLATSRHVLKLYGEQVLAVAPLELPETHAAAPDAMGHADAVRLFVHRARLRRPHFAPSPDEMALIARTCRQLEGIPLSIELAAARVGLLSVADIAEQVEDCFGALLSTEGPSPRRHRSLHAAIAWSHELLTPEERAVFRRLSPCRGWFDLATVVTLGGDAIDAGGAGALRVLSALHDKSMLVADGAGDVAFYRMLEPLRQFGRQQLAEAGETDDAARRHARCMLELAERAEGELRGPRRGAWFERLDRSHDDVRAALRWTVDAGETELGLRLGAAMWRYWYQRSFAAEGRDHLVALLERTAASTSAELRANARHAAGTLASYAGDYDQAAALLEAALAARRDLDDTAGAAASLNNLGMVRFDQGRYAESAAFFREALALHRALGDVRSAAVSLGNVATAAIEDGAYDLADDCARESRALERQCGIASSSHTATGTLARIAADRGDYATARALTEEVLATARDTADRLGMAHYLRRLWQVTLREGDLVTARARLEESLAIARRFGGARTIAPTLSSLGVQLLCEERPREALAQIGAALALLARNARPIDLVDTWLDLARAHLRLGDLGSARASLASAATTLRSLRNFSAIVELLDLLVQLESAEGSYRPALVLAAHAAGLRASAGTCLPPPFRAELAQAIAKAEAALGDDGARCARAASAAMSRDEAFALALGELAPDRSDRSVRASENW